VAVDGAVHNVYVTPDGKYAVSGSVATSVISVIDTATDAIAWTLKESSGVRPMIFTTKADGSTDKLLVQLSNYHGIAEIDSAGVRQPVCGHCGQERYRRRRYEEDGGDRDHSGRPGAEAECQRLAAVMVRVDI